MAGDYEWLSPQENIELPLGERPTFRDLQKHSEVGIVKRAIGRYLFARNYERSIKMHTMLGAPLVRKAVMATIGRKWSHSGSGGNYRLDGTKSRIEAATTFATNASVFNEAIHTLAATPASLVVASDVFGGHYGKLG